MKKLMTAALAASLIAGTVGMATAASAQPYHQDRYERQDDRYDRQDDRYDRRDDRRDDRRGDYRRGDQRYGNHYGNAYGHRYARGQRYGYQRNYVDYRGHHNLRRPPRGYGWVQDRNDFLLVALTTGLIAEIISSR